MVAVEVLKQCAIALIQPSHVFVSWDEMGYLASIRKLTCQEHKQPERQKTLCLIACEIFALPVLAILA